MRRIGLALALTLVVFPATAAWAGSFMAVFTRGGGLRVTASGSAVGPAAAGGLVILSGARSMGGFGPAGFSGRTYLIVDAHPLDAQVFLDGRLLGSGRDLVARAFPMAPGRHAIEVVAPGFVPYIAQFAVASGSFPVRFRVALSQQP